MQSRKFLVLSVILAAGVVSLLVGTATLRGDVAPEYKFQFNILGVTNTAPGQKPVVTYSVTNPQTGSVYDLFGDPAFTAPGGLSRLFVQIAWSTAEFNNTGSGSQTVPVGPTPASPVAINALSATAVTDNGDGTYTVTSPKAIPSGVKGSGAVAMEGHPAFDSNGDGVMDARAPVRSTIRYFAITDPSPVARRLPVDIDKCKSCHQPHLSLHGNNRTDEPRVCVMCHNPDNTDIAYRTAGAEAPIDFKYMVHAIHAGGRRQTPFVVIGFQGSVNDFSGVRFPRELSDCLNCHIDGKFELPLGKQVLGTTVATGSTLSPKVVDAEPANNLRISPTAAVCSSCHDDGETRTHMMRNGGQFNVTQARIAQGTERCVTCHGPGKREDVRRVHEIGHTDN